MTRAHAGVVALLLSGITAFDAAHPTKAQSGDGWIPLFDGKSIGDQWNQVGATNWRVEDGAIVADKRTSKEAAHLVS